MKIVYVLLLTVSGLAADQPRDVNEAAVAARRIVPHIQRADYQDNRAALKTLHDDLRPYAADKQIGTRVLYWQGFALWRGALNCFNDAVDYKEIEQDLRGAVADFEAAYGRDPNFADAKIGAASCLMNLLYIHLKEPGATQEYAAKFKPLFRDAETISPDNPRLMWIKGPALWYMPVEAGGGSGNAIAAYGRGLEIVHGQTRKSADPLDPSWGEPELLMNLAWSNLN